MEVVETLEEGKTKITKINELNVGKDKNGFPTLFLSGNHQKTIISLDFRDIIGFIETSVDGLNRINNDIQQHIRTNKDKENQEIVNTLKKYYTMQKEEPEGLAKEALEWRRTASQCIENIIEDATGKEIKDL